MKNLVRLSALMLLLSFTLSGCYYDKEDLLYPAQTICDTSNVTYSKTIAGIMSAHCNKCHSTLLQSGGYITDTYADLSLIATVDGPLWKGVDWQYSGSKNMPQNEPQLTDCELAKIKIWIDKGAPNN